MSEEFGGLVGLLIAVLRVSGLAPLRWVAALYVLVVQGTPLLAWLFVFFFGLSIFGITVSPWIAATAALAYAVRDVLARQRLHADAEGVVAVRGFATRRRLAWDQIERLGVDSRLRFGARSELLELDAGEEIFQYSRYDLGVRPEDALEALEGVRQG